MQKRNISDHHVVTRKHCKNKHIISFKS